MTFESDDIVDTGATENTAAEVETEQTEWQPESEAQESEQQEPEEKEEGEQEEKPKRNRAQERIQQLAREKAEMAAKLAEYEAKANQPAQASEGPAIEDFEDYSEFKKAERKWLMGEAKREFREEMLAEKQQQTQIEKQAEFEAAIADLEEDGIDFNVYAQKAEVLPQLPIQLDQFGLSASETLRLAKELIDDEDTYIAISQMTTVQAAMRIGQIIAQKQPKPAPKVSKAPPPIKPVQANAPASRSPEKMSDDEWYRAETQLRKGK